jgi:hypothetical protein
MTPAVNQLLIAGFVDTADKLITGVNDVINFITVSFANCSLCPATPARCQANPALCKATAARFQDTPAPSQASSAHLKATPALCRATPFRCPAPIAQFFISPALQ